MKRILIVDDRKTNLISTKNVLESAYKVIAVPSGVQALNYLENNTCDLILLDILMPEMNGFEVLERIKSNDKTASIPVIFLTSNNDAETENKCLEAGAMDFIPKSSAPAVMLSRIEHAIELEEMRRRLADELEEKIQEVSEIKSKFQQDALTGLWNRTYTEKAVNSILSEGGKGALFMIDMDNFKAINDNYGHIEGDNTLKMFAETMRKFSSENDILCRIGGDEFIMFVNGAVSKRELGDLAQNIISDLCAKIEDKNFRTNSSVSIGIAQSPDDGTDFGAVYKAADKALYHTKLNGKNSYHFFSEQKEKENSRSSTLVDLKYLKEIISRMDTGRGAYQLDIENFRHVYNFIRRFVERSGNDVQVVLFTALADENTDQTEVEAALEMLEQAIYRSLRRVDVSTRYSSKQIIVILLDANDENGDIVAKRIIDCFGRICPSGKVGMRYDIAKMEGKLTAEGVTER